VERIRQLFDDLERKEELIDLLDRAEHADGVKIFIGSENPLFSLSGSSVIGSVGRHWSNTVELRARHSDDGLYCAIIRTPA